MTDDRSGSDVPDDETAEPLDFDSLDLRQRPGGSGQKDPAEGHGADRYARLGHPGGPEPAGGGGHGREGGADVAGAEPRLKDEAAGGDPGSAPAGPSLPDVGPVEEHPDGTLSRDLADRVRIVANPAPASVPPLLNDDGEMEVRATINLPGLRIGDTAFVNPRIEYVSACLEAGYVVPV